VPSPLATNLSNYRIDTIRRPPEGICNVRVGVRRRLDRRMPERDRNRLEVDASLAAGDDTRRRLLNAVIADALTRADGNAA